MKRLEQFFDSIGHAITSMAAVIFVMLMTISGMIFFSHTLFIQVFPDSMETWEKLAATWLMALGWEFTVLITTCNTRHINRFIPLIMAASSGVIVLFFIQAFDSMQTPLALLQRWFVGVLAATINYIYAELFYAKWQERGEQHAMPMQLAQTQSNLIQLQSAFDQAQSALDEARSTLNERDRKLEELEQFKDKIDTALTCTHCKVVQNSYGTLQAHKGYCDKNPNRRLRQPLNGTQ